MFRVTAYLYCEEDPNDLIVFDKVTNVHGVVQRIDIPIDILGIEPNENIGPNISLRLEVQVEPEDGKEN